MHPGSLHGDIEWYRRKAVESGGPVLELGAGTGRITIPIAEAGIRVTALDLNAGMLDKLRQKASTLSADVRERISISRGDMRAFALDDRFALVVIPFRAFLHNATRDDQLATLRSAHAHLRGGGEVALNVFHPSLEFMAANAGALTGVWRWRATRKLPAGGFVVYSECSRYYTVHQRLESMLRTEEFASDGSLRRTNMMHLELAYLYPSDVTSLLAESGFELLRMSGDFVGRAFERDGDELVVEARKR
jgi:ubiquinone/menaquinone biosynthesis C-methylase UbiE